MTDLLSDELNEIVDPGDEIEPEIEPEPPIEYTKTGRIRKPRTQAQIDGFAKARAKWVEMRSETSVEKKKLEVKSRELTLEKAKKDAEADVARKCERAKKRYEAAKAKVPELVVPEPVPEDEAVAEVREVYEPPSPPRHPSPVKRTRKKKPVVIVQDSDDSELESDNPQVIFVKKKTKPKEEQVTPPPPPDPRFSQAKDNPFGRNYFYDRNAMS